MVDGVKETGLLRGDLSVFVFHIATQTKSQQLILCRVKVISFKDFLLENSLMFTNQILLVFFILVIQDVRI